MKELEPLPPQRSAGKSPALMSKSETAELRKELKEMIIAFVLSIIACAIPSTILFVQVMCEIARNLANRHYKKHHNFDTIWWHIEHALDPFTF